MTRWHQQHQAIDLTALDTLELSSYLAMMLRCSIFLERQFGEADQTLLRFHPAQYLALDLIRALRVVDE